VEVLERWLPLEEGKTRGCVIRIKFSGDELDSLLGSASDRCLEKNLIEIELVLSSSAEIFLWEK
jgi:hypothetical protein